MVQNDWLCQFLADLLDVSVQRPQVIETTALGAAMLAGVGAGLYESLQAAGECCVASEKQFAPVMPATQREALLAGWEQAVRRTLHD